MVAFLLVACGVEVAASKHCKEEACSASIESTVGNVSASPSRPRPFSTGLKNVNDASAESASPSPSSTVCDAGVDAAPTPVGACVSFQAVTCTVYYVATDAGCDGTWRTDGDCFARSEHPFAGCEMSDRTEWFFHWGLGSTSDIERSGAANSCSEQGGVLL